MARSPAAVEMPSGRAGPDRGGAGRRRRQSARPGRDAGRQFLPAEVRRLPPGDHPQGRRCPALESPRRRVDPDLSGDRRGRPPPDPAGFGRRQRSLLLERLSPRLRPADPTAQRGPSQARPAPGGAAGVVRRVRSARRRRCRPAAPAMAYPPEGPQRLAPWQPPLQLCPSTTDPDEAQTWMDRYAAAGPGGATVPLHCG
jgi:hypothetical protein